jgi:hypothetical protein
MSNEDSTVGSEAAPNCVSWPSQVSSSARTISRSALLGVIAVLSIAAVEPASAQTQQKQPNILFIMGDDIGRA